MKNCFITLWPGLEWSGKDLHCIFLPEISVSNCEWKG